MYMYYRYTRLVLFIITSILLHLKPEYKINTAV
jgi:hypothetical protein